MKVKNIMFSGFMAAILTGVACSADAAGFQVASKQYVDAREDVIVAAQEAVDTQQNTEIAKKEDADNKVRTKTAYDALGEQDDKTKLYTSVAVAEAIAQSVATSATGAVETRVGTLETKVGTLETDVDTLETTVNDATNGLVKKVADLEAVDTAMDGRVDTLETTVGTLGTDVNTLETTVGDVNSGLVKDVDDLQEALTVTGSTGSAIKANADAIAEIKDSNTGVLATAQKYADDQDAAQTTAITNAYEAYALPKPSAECANTTCVLATDKNGQPYWTQLWMYGADGQSATETNP